MLKSLESGAVKHKIGRLRSLSKSHLASMTHSSARQAVYSMSQNKESCQTTKCVQLFIHDRDGFLSSAKAVGLSFNSLRNVWNAISIFLIWPKGVNMMLS